MFTGLSALCVLVFLRLATALRLMTGERNLAWQMKVKKTAGNLHNILSFINLFCLIETTLH